MFLIFFFFFLVTCTTRPAQELTGESPSMHVYIVKAAQGTTNVNQLKISK